MAARPSLWLITLAVLFLSSPLDAFASRSNSGAKKMTTSTAAAAAVKVRAMEGDEEESRGIFRSVANSTAAPGAAESSSARQVPTGPDPIHHHGGPPLGGRRRLLLQLQR